METQHISQSSMAPRQPAPRAETNPQTIAAAEDFEAFFVAYTFEEMFAGIGTDPLFGGGQGESVFRTFLIQEYGKQVARAGGIGIADMVQRQLMTLQEVSP